MHHIEIVRKKNSSKLLHGKYCELWIDGKKLEGVMDFDLNISPKKPSVITIQLIGSFDIIDEE